MPGLVGFTGAAGAPTREASLRAMQETLRHRDFYQQDALFCDDLICATRCHLGVMQTAPQPHSDRGMHVWFDGELSNRHELRQRLTRVADSDPAILLGLLRECFERDELSLLAKIDGLYSAVIYDEANRRLLLLNDRYGARPLYWGCVAGELVWSSEQKAITALAKAPSEIDPAAVGEFLETGSLFGDRSWLPGIQRLAAATLLSWNLDDKTHCEEHYWSWEQIRPAVAPFDEVELSAEIGRRFQRAVRQRAPAEDRMGLYLDGRLASRALLAAIPERETPLPVATFAAPGCEDARLAMRTAALRSTEHRVYELSSSDWLDSRVAGVWWTEGLQNLFHMREAASLLDQAKHYDIVLSDFGGDALAEESPTRLQFRPDSFRVQFEQRLPFMANDFVELLFSLPPELRSGTRLFEQFLVTRWPDLFRRIPRAPGDSAIGASSIHQIAKRMISRLRGATGGQTHRNAETPRWLRQGRGRECVQELLLAQDAAILEFVDRPSIDSLWEQHLRGADHSEQLGRWLTLELWLNQLLGGRYRPEPCGRASASG